MLIYSTRYYASITVFSGAYVPVTMEGNIIIDGVLSSCYASTSHDLAHITMTPLRWFSWIMDWVFGVDNGSSVYVKVVEDFGRMVVPHGGYLELN